MEFKIIDKLETVKNNADIIGNLAAGVENFLCDMEEEPQTDPYRVAVLISTLRKIVDDLGEDVIAPLADMISDMGGDSPEKKAYLKKLASLPKTRKEEMFDRFHAVWMAGAKDPRYDGLDRLLLSDCDPDSFRKEQ